MNYVLFWDLTATLCSNRAINALSLLNLLWKSEWVDKSDSNIQILTNQRNFDSKENEKNDDDFFSRLFYDNVRRRFVEHDFEKNDSCYSLLQSSLFKAFQIRDDISLTDVSIILLIIWKVILMCRIWRSMIEIIDDENIIIVMIEFTLSKYKMTNIEIKFFKRVQVEHDVYYFPLVERLNSKSEVEDKAAKLSNDISKTQTNSQDRVNWHIIRRLFQLSLCLKMKRLATDIRKKNLAIEMRAWTNKYNDRDASFFFQSTCKNINVALSQTALKMIYYLAADFSKLQMIDSVISNVILTQKKRTIIVFHWLVSSWSENMFFDNLSVKTLQLHASLRFDERKKMTDLWNDSNSSYEILLITYQTATHDLNLHLACHNMILVKLSININEFIQMLDRLYRVRQTKVSHFYVISQRHTFNRFEKYNAIKKMLDQIADDYSKVFQKIDSCIKNSKTETQSDDDDETNVVREVEINDQIRTVVEQTESMINFIIEWEISRLIFNDWIDLKFDWDKNVNDKRMIFSKKTEIEVDFEEASTISIREISQKLLACRENTHHRRSKKRNSTTEKKSEESKSSKLIRKRHILSFKRVTHSDDENDTEDSSRDETNDMF